jgi:ferrochelatase
VSTNPANRARAGVLVMAHGTPSGPRELEAFYTRIRRGSPPSAEQLAELRARYDAIGGVSPLADRTRHQVDAIAGALHRKAPGRFVVRFGAKHTAPFIEDAAAELAAVGVGAVVGLVLTPHRSSMGSGEYLGRAAAALAAADPAPEFVAVEQWYDEPAFVDLMADRVLAALEDLRASVDGRIVTVFTAHSLPARVVEEGDVYPAQVEDSASRVAELAEIDDTVVAWQSAGRSAGPWLGPDLRQVIARLAAEGAGGVLVCPIGFVADHLEILYDLDIEAAAVARDEGIAFARTASLDDDARFIAVLADVLERAAPHETDGSGA